jgi:hypothetical protein
VAFTSVTGLTHWCAAAGAASLLWPVPEGVTHASPSSLVGGLCVALVGGASLLASMASGSASQGSSTRTRNLPVVAALDVFVVSSGQAAKSLASGGVRDRWVGAVAGDGTSVSVQGDAASSCAGSDGDSTPSRYSAVDDSSLLDEADEALLLGSGPRAQHVPITV